MAVFELLASPQASTINAILQIYEEAFPANERHASGVIRERVAQARYKLIAGRNGDEIVFFALLWPLRGTDFILLDYMATKSTFRGRGIGEDFLNRVLKMPEIAGKSLLMEVENPAVGENRAQRGRRVEFYKRMGAKELRGVRYVMPGLSGGDPTEMILMVLANAAPREMDGSVVRGLIIQVYEELYARRADDPLLRSLIDGVPDRVALGQKNEAQEVDG